MYMYSWNYQTEEGSQRVTRKQVLRDMQIVFLQTLFSNRGGGKILIDSCVHPNEKNGI